MANKSTTIKNATDQELEALLFRLRRERELQNVIANLKRGSSSYELMPGESISISTEVPIDSLYHYGILGMKWGVRRERGADGRVTSKPASADYTRSRRLKAKGSKRLSTSELQEVTKRLNLEKQLKDMSPSEIDKGLAFIKKLTAAGTTLAALYALTKTPLGQDIIKAVKTSSKKAK